MPKQAVAGDIRSAAQIELQCQLACRPIQALHPIDDFGHILRLRLLLFQGGGCHAEAERFGEDKRVAGLESAFAQHPAGIHKANGNQSIFRLIILHRMATGDHDARFTRLFRSAADDLTRDLHRQISRQGGDVQSQEGLSAHGIDIRQTVGRRDGSIVVGIVHHRREKIGGHNNGTILRQTPDSRVVRFPQSHQQIGV